MEKRGRQVAMAFLALPSPNLIQVSGKRNSMAHRRNTTAEQYEDIRGRHRCATESGLCNTVRQRKRPGGMTQSIAMLLKWEHQRHNPHCYGCLMMWWFAFASMPVAVLVRYLGEIRPILWSNPHTQVPRLWCFRDIPPSYYRDSCMFQAG